MSWTDEVKEIKKRLSLIQEMGGKEKIKRQHDAGRSTVRERILALLDKNSFKEIGSLTGSSEYDENGKLKTLLAANSVIGHGKINNAPVFPAERAIWLSLFLTDSIALHILDLLFFLAACNGLSLSVIINSL